MKKRWSRTALGAGIFALVCVPGCGGDSETSGPPTTVSTTLQLPVGEPAVPLPEQPALQGDTTQLPDIILVTIDTLRADRLSASGYFRQTTPFLDELAGTGVRFTRAYSTSSWTVPAVASLMTSLHPQSHGVVNGYLYDKKVQGQEVLPATAPVLAEMLKEHGYRTYGVTANGHLAVEHGYARGFDRYLNLGFRATAESVNTALKTVLPDLDGEAPYFLWLHYFDPHDPYWAPTRFRRQFATYEGDEPPVPAIPIPARYKKRFGVTAGSDKLAYVEALYDAEVRFTDESIGAALDLLDAGTDSLILVTADHGEEFLEHDGFGHRRIPHEEQIRVPLIVRFPGNRFAGQVRDEPVSLVDVLPTLLHGAGLPAPPGLQGRQLVSLLEGDVSRPRRIVSSATLLDGLKTHALIEAGWKYIRIRGRESRDLLFHLTGDPQERINLSATHASRRDGLKDRLQQALTSQGRTLHRPQLVQAPPEKVDELRSLGYVN